MNALLAHEEYVCSHLEDRAAARGLIDHRQELLDEPHAVAVYAVAAIRQAVRCARRLADATARLAPDHSSSRPLAALIRSYVSNPYRDDGYILVVQGGRKPTCHGTYLLSTPPQHTNLCITVGASWVLRHVEAMERAWADAMQKHGSVEAVLNAM